MQDLILLIMLTVIAILPKKKGCSYDE